MPVDLAGFPCDYDEINALVNKRILKQNLNPPQKNKKNWDEF